MPATDEEAEIRLLADAAYGFDERDADLFMESPQKLLDGRRPSDMIAAGEGAEVRRVLERVLEILD